MRTVRGRKQTGAGDGRRRWEVACRTHRSEKSDTSSSGLMATTGNLTPPLRGPACFCIPLSTGALLAWRSLFVPARRPSAFRPNPAELIIRQRCVLQLADTPRTSAKHITLQHPPLSHHLVIIALLLHGALENSHLSKGDVSRAPPPRRDSSAATSTAIYLLQAVIGGGSGGNTWREMGCCWLTGR